jgi:acetylornithine deacetylase/succinyl-diaminopimelate desuccinylase-like protein
LILDTEPPSTESKPDVHSDLTKLDKNMTASRESAISRARSFFDDGSFVSALTTLVAVKTESHPPEHRGELVRYASEVLGPMVGKLGFELTVLENPHAEHGPALLATRIEDPNLPTVLIYGHGDVVRAMPELWREGLDPWTVTVEDDRIFGRGVVDNKGQHLVAIQAIAAVLETRGTLGFNAKIFVETGEEAGSPGLREMLERNREVLAADVFIAFDGLRQSTGIPEVTLGTRGAVTMDLVVDLRKGGFHSGHWGGLLADSGVLLSHAIAAIISPTGKILVEGWTPGNIPDAVRQACKNIRSESLPGAQQPDPGWGEPGMSRAERIFMWSSAIVLSMVTGQPDSPVNAVNGSAKARLQLRHTVDVDASQVIPALRRHLDARGLEMVEVHPVIERQQFLAARTAPDNPWVEKIVDSFRLTSGQEPNVVPNIGASGPSELFETALGTPIIWIPFSYGGCSQHGPDEHGLGSLFRQGLGEAAGLWWDLGSAKIDRRHDS